MENVERHRVREPFEEKTKCLTGTLEEYFAEGTRLEQAIRQNLKSFGYGR